MSELIKVSPKICQKCKTIRRIATSLTPEHARRAGVTLPSGVTTMTSTASTSLRGLAKNEA